MGEGVKPEQERAERRQRIDGEEKEAMLLEEDCGKIVKDEKVIARAKRHLRERSKNDLKERERLRRE